MGIGSVGNPVRLDPWQNIVEVHWPPVPFIAFRMSLFGYFSRWAGAPTPCSDPSPPTATGGVLANHNGVHSVDARRAGPFTVSIWRETVGGTWEEGSMPHLSLTGLPDWQDDHTSSAYAVDAYRQAIAFFGETLYEMAPNGSPSGPGADMPVPDVFPVVNFESGPDVILNPWLRPRIESPTCYFFPSENIKAFGYDTGAAEIVNPVTFAISAATIDYRGRRYIPIAANIRPTTSDEEYSLYDYQTGDFLQTTHTINQTRDNSVTFLCQREDLIGDS